MSAAGGRDELVGRTLGEFVLTERIGEGGFGAVYRATQPALEREAVVKVLHAHLHAARAATDRFLREARLASKLDHPYAAHIYAFGAEPDGQLWIAMELVRGSPLDQLLKVQGPIALERFVPLLDRICEVVHTAHEAGIVHRDLKPANVMVLSRAGRLLPKLLDFGIAKGLAGGNTPASRDDDGKSAAQVPAVNVNAFDATFAGNDAAIERTDGSAAGPAVDLTQRGVIMGSPHYMAPEQWLDAGDVDARADLYALAVLAYECLTGKPPFTGKTVTAVAQAHANALPPSLGPDFPPALDHVLRRALAKEAKDRYPNALALAAEFRTAAGLADEAASLPAIEPALREAAITQAPQPIAEAIAAYEAARSLYQARDALALFARTVARYLGLLALACHSRITGPESAAASIRQLYRRSFGDAEWLAFGRELTRPWLERRDLYPVPELVGALHEARVIDHLAALVTLRDSDGAGDGRIAALVQEAVGRVEHLLAALAFLRDYPLVVAITPSLGERWMGARRVQRSTVPIRGVGVAVGVPSLLDRDGSPVLTLAPLFQIATPAAAAPFELFMLEGRDRQGAKLVSLPAGFVLHDDTVWDWLRMQLGTSLDDGNTDVALEKAPYLGLAPFSPEDSAMYFGREKAVDGFVNRLKLQPLLAIVGRSGAGKSSFVYAGVVPALPSGWRVLALRPGASPVSALVAKLEHAGIAATRAELAGDRDVLGERLRADAGKRGPLLVVVDQLEELFTLCQDEDERRVFAEALAAAARSADDPVRVVFTLRDDFLVRTEQVAGLRNRIGHGLQLLTLPVADDLRRIVVEPARRLGYELEAGLADEIVKEVADQPGALALISFAASKLWELRDRHFKQLTRAAYQTLGGVGGALSRHADQTVDAMLPEERALTREAFRHLVTSQSTRAVVARADLKRMLGVAALADAVLEKLIAARLLVASENEAGAETIEIIHEALLAVWPRLVEWRAEDRDGARFREQLHAAAEQWAERGRRKGLLWRGEELSDLARWRARSGATLAELETSFAEASQAEAQRGKRNRRLLLAGAFAVLGAGIIALAVLSAGLASQRAAAEASAQDLNDHLRSQYENQGRRFLLDGDPLQALAYLDQSAKAGTRGREHDFLVAQAVEASDGELFEVTQGNSVASARFSHDGKHFVTSCFDHFARIWDATTGKLELELAHADVAHDAVFSPDDSRVLTTSVDGSFAVWDAHTGRQLHRFAQGNELPHAMFSPDGQLVVSGGAGGLVVVRDAASGAERTRTQAGHTGISACAFAADGQMFAMGDADGGVWTWSVSGTHARELHGLHGSVPELAFSPDGTRIAASSDYGATMVWDTKTGAALFTLVQRGFVYSTAFSPDGRDIITGAADHTAIVWDATTGKERMRLEGHSSGVLRVGYAPDGKTIVTAAGDATVRLWDATTGHELARWHGHQSSVTDARFDPSSHHVVTTGEDGRAIVWRAEPQEQQLWLRGQGGLLSDGAFSPDGRLVVTASTSDPARIWSSETGESLHVLGNPGDATPNARFSPDGTRVATRSSGGAVRVWDATTGALERTFAEPSKGDGGSVDWSPDGTLVVAAAMDGWIRCWDVRTGTARFATRGHDGFGVYSATFDPNGRTIITTGDDLVIRRWDLDGHSIEQDHDHEGIISAAFDASGARIISAGSRQRAVVIDAKTGKVETELVGHSGPVTDARWAPMAGWAITASNDSSARIWDAKGRTLAIFHQPGAVLAAAFSHDGRRVLLAGEAGLASIRTLALDPPDPARLAEILACRLPFEVRDEQLVPRDKVACSAAR